MAPKKRIVTLKDLTSHRMSSDGDDAAEDLRDGWHDSRKRTDGGVPLAPPNNPGYCQPVGKDGGGGGDRSIPLYILPGLPQSDVCEATLKRIHDEFLPIIRRRGYNVRSVSELCCCGDGLDHRPETEGGRRRRRDCPRMGDNVLGYNRTTSSSGRAGTTARSHTIHLRLRDSRNHAGRLLPWEDVAGTMAHELSHCVHQNHGDAFFRLMEELLEEHATLQLYGPAGPAFLRPANAHAVVRREDASAAAVAAATAAAAVFPPGAGRTLGGASARSRLLDAGTASGGGGGALPLGGTTTTRPLSRDELRRRVADAAETRQRQLQQVRRIAERSKQPCVIEILDDDDDDDCDGDAVAVAIVRPAVAAATPTSAGTGLDVKPPAKRTAVPQSSSATEKRRARRQRHEVAKEASVIDLTQEGKVETTTPCGRNWSCLLCTFLNAAQAVGCEMCNTTRQT